MFYVIIIIIIIIIGYRDIFVIVTNVKMGTT